MSGRKRRTHYELRDGEAWCSTRQRERLTKDIDAVSCKVCVHHLIKYGRVAEDDDRATRAMLEHIRRSRAST